MKTILVLFAIVGLSFAAPRPLDLVDDFRDLLDLIPLDDIREITRDRLATDGALATVVLYLQGPEWAELVDTIRNNPAVQRFVEYLTDAGLPVSDIVAGIRDLIANAEPTATPDPNGSLRPFLDEVRAIIPTDDLIALLNDKLQNNLDFQALYGKVSSAEARALVEEVRAIDEVQRLAQRLRDLDVRVDEVLAVVYEFLGWGEAKLKNIASRDLIDDIRDLLDLIPLDDIREITRDRLATDGALATVVLYFQGPEWAGLVDTIRNNPAVQSFVEYLTDAGVPVSDIVAGIRDLIANAEPTATPDPNGSLRSFLDEVRALIPTDDLIALLNDKLQNNLDFQALYGKVSSAEARALVEEVRAIDEVQRLAQRLRDLDVRIDEVLAVVYEFLGWGEPNRF